MDDDVDDARRLAKEIDDRLGPASVVPDVYQALARLSEEPFDAVVLEVALPGASGIDLLERLTGGVPAVVLTWLVSPPITARALAAGAHTVLTKPCGTDDVIAAIRQAVRARTGAVLVGS